MEDNPVLPRLYLTGVFFFILMYTGSNVLPIASFFKYTHTKQAFRSDEVSTYFRLQCQIYAYTFLCLRYNIIKFNKCLNIYANI